MLIELFGGDSVKVALVCPSNMLYMPYVSNYEKILKGKNVDYDIINWDRFNIEDEDNSLKYRDSKIGHQRNFLDYYEFKKFIIKSINSIKYDKVIVFGIQLTFFLKDILLKKYKSNYIIDIRDYNKIIRVFNIKKLINNSAFTVISSSGYKVWLPNNYKFIVNHNTQISCLDELKEINSVFAAEKINIAYIGSIRDLTINIDFINSLKNNQNINLFYDGEGTINKDIADYLKANNILNVFLTGRYKKENEENLYKKSDIINVLIPNNHINSKTLLPNRLYNAVLQGKPIIAFEGTYLTEQVNNHNLGMVIKSFDRVEEKINNYLNNFDVERYKVGRVSFFEEVIRDNESFRTSIEKFIGS